MQFISNMCWNPRWLRHAAVELRFLLTLFCLFNMQINSWAWNLSSFSFQSFQSTFASISPCWYSRGIWSSCTTSIFHGSKEVGTLACRETQSRFHVLDILPPLAGVWLLKAWLGDSKVWWSPLNNHDYREYLNSSDQESLCCWRFHLGRSNLEQKRK